MRQRLPTLLTFVAAALLHGWSLRRYPVLFVDEAWFASRAWEFIHTGRAFGSLDAGVIDRFEGYWTFFPWLPTVIQSAVLRFAAAPTLLSVRLTALAFGFALLAALYAIAHRLGGPWLGVITVAIVSVSSPFFHSAHLGRYDIFAAAFGFGAVALYLNNRAQRPWLSALSGLLVALAFECHPNSIAFGPAIVALYFLHHRWAMFRQRGFWALVGGVLLGLAGYAALHILPYPQTYLALNQLAFTATHTPPLFTLDPAVLGQAVTDMGVMLLYLYLPLIPLIVWAVVALARRHSDEDRTLLVLGGVLTVGHLLLVRNKFLYYTILYTPSIDLLLAALLLTLARRPWRGLPADYARRAAVGGLCAAFVLGNLAPLRTDYYPIYQAAQSQVNRAVMPADSIIGSQTFWFGLYEHKYYSWEEIIYYRRYAPGSTLEDALRALHPDILIIDRHLDRFISDEPDGSTYSQHLTLSRREMEAFLAAHAQLVTEFDNSYYGRVRVYRLEW